MSIDDERQSVYQQLGYLGDRIASLEQSHEEMRGVVRDAVAEAIPSPALSEQEAQWVKLAIQREAQSIKLRQAVIEKTLSGLIWAAIAGLGIVLLEYIKAHGWKP